MPHPSLKNNQHIIYREMMTHPALFTHSYPKKIVIIGDEDQLILAEAIKHLGIKEIYHITQDNISLLPTDHQIIHYHGNYLNWAKNQPANTFDVIINVSDFNAALLPLFFSILNQDGILVQQSSSPFELHELKNHAHTVQQSGFSDLQLLSFPQPDFTSGWRSALLALKHGIFRRLREKAIFTKPFKTHYYNFDIHKAALVLPEFIREEWVT